MLSKKEVIYMNNEIIDGKIRGRSKDDYQRNTHYNNSDQ